MAADKPRGFVCAGRQANPQPRPDIVCTAAMDEDVIVGFKDTLTEFTVCFLSLTAVFMVKVCPSVETPMVDQPTEEFHLARELGVPYSSSIRILAIVCMKQSINIFGVERSVRGVVKEAVVGPIIEGRELNAAPKNGEFFASCPC